MSRMNFSIWYVIRLESAHVLVSNKERCILCLYKNLLQKEFKLRSRTPILLQIQIRTLSMWSWWNALHCGKLLYQTECQITAGKVCNWLLSFRFEDFLVIFEKFVTYCKYWNMLSFFLKYKIHLWHFINKV